MTLADLGYDGVELTLEHPELNPDSADRWDASKLKNMLQNAGLEAAAISFHGKKAGWDEKRRKCTAGLRLAHDLETSSFVSSSCLGQSPYRFAQTCIFVEDMCRLAEELCVDFAVEPEPGTLIEGSQKMAELMDAVKSPRLKVNLDVGHSHITEGDVCADILRWRRDIVHVHLEDIKGKEHRHLLPGQGDLDFRSIVAAFDTAGYSGYFTMDLFDILDNPERYAKEGIQSLWRILNG